MTISDDGLADDAPRDDLADAAARDDLADRTDGPGPAGRAGAKGQAGGRTDTDPSVGESAGGCPALASRRRRAIVAELRAADSPVDVRTLANRVAAREYDPTAESTVFQQRQRVFVSLERTHLPALDEAGIVGYDRARGIVTLLVDAGDAMVADSSATLVAESSDGVGQPIDTEAADDRRGNPSPPDEPVHVSVRADHE